MWKAAVVLLALTVGISQLFKSSVPEIPKLPEQWWGPGRATAKVDTSIRPFKIDVPKDVIDDLRERLARTRPLKKPLEGAAWTYGISTDYLKTVIDYWQNKYDWSKRQALLNKYPQFKTNIQGLDIHFYHVKPTIPKDRKNVKVLPLLLLHGWPGSVVEFQKILPLLTAPRPDKDFVFEVIAPSLPGYGFSDAAVRPGLATPQIALIMRNLMLRLGFDKFYAQGGDWGSVIANDLSALYPEHVSGLHLNICLVQDTSTVFWTIIGAYLPFLTVSDEHYSKMYPLSDHWSRNLEESGYMHIQATKPDTVGVALTDSPAGLAAYILEKFSTWTNPQYRFRDDGALLEKYNLDELLDNVMVYWVTSSITTSMRLYSEEFSRATRKLGMDNIPVKPPTSCASFPHEIIYQPESLLRGRYPNLVQFNHLPEGGHFAAFEEPELLATDVWSFVTKVRALREAARKTEEEAARKTKEEASKKKKA